MEHLSRRAVGRLCRSLSVRLCTGGPANIGSGGDDGELKASEHNKNTNNIGESVAQLGLALAAAGVPEPDLSSRYLVSQVLRQPRADDYLAFAGESLSPAEQQELERLVHCRLARMPLQYIAGNWDFRTIRLTTRPPVFIPRHALHVSFRLANIWTLPIFLYNGKTKESVFRKVVPNSISAEPAGSVLFLTGAELLTRLLHSFGRK